MCVLWWIPLQVVLDGKSMLPVLLNNASSQHDCLFHYKGSPGLSCPKDHPDCPGLWTVRTTCIYGFMSPTVIPLRDHS